jgi:hypothetical protein
MTLTGLHYKTLLSGAQMAADRGFEVGIVTNACWAVDENDAREGLKECPREDAYADACHFCYEVRRALRARFPEVLKPDPMYGVMEKKQNSGVHE